MIRPLHPKTTGHPVTADAETLGAAAAAAGGLFATLLAAVSSQSTTGTPGVKGSHAPASPLPASVVGDGKTTAATAGAGVATAGHATDAIAVTPGANTPGSKAAARAATPAGSTKHVATGHRGPTTSPVSPNGNAETRLASTPAAEALETITSVTVHRGRTAVGTDQDIDSLALASAPARRVSSADHRHHQHVPHATHSVPPGTTATAAGTPAEIPTATTPPAAPSPTAPPTNAADADPTAPRTAHDVTVQPLGGKDSAETDHPPASTDNVSAVFAGRVAAEPASHGSLSAVESTPTVGPAPATPATPTAEAPPQAVAVRSMQAPVFDEITRLASQGNGVRRLSLTLQPESLGEVRVVLSVRDGEVHVRLHAASPEAQAALSDDSHELVRLLETAGMSHAKVVVRDLPQESAPMNGQPQSQSATGEGPQHHAGTRGQHPATDGTNDTTPHRGAGVKEPRSIEPVVETRTTGVDVTV